MQHRRKCVRVCVCAFSRFLSVGDLWDVCSVSVISLSQNPFLNHSQKRRSRPCKTDRGKSRRKRPISVKVWRGCTRSHVVSHTCKTDTQQTENFTQLTCSRSCPVKQTDSFASFMVAHGDPTERTALTRSPFGTSTYVCVWLSPARISICFAVLRKVWNCACANLTWTSKGGCWTFSINVSNTQRYDGNIKRRLLRFNNIRWRTSCWSCSFGGFYLNCHQ